MLDANRNEVVIRNDDGDLESPGQGDLDDGAALLYGNGSPVLAMDGITRTVKVADLTGNKSGNCPVVRINNYVADPNALGSNGFPGFQPGDAGENTVRSVAAYVDIESNVNEVLQLGGAWRFMSRARNYGEYYDAPTNDGTVAFYPQPSTVFDFEAGYEVNESFSLAAGVQNAFDEYPSTNPHGEVAGLIYPEQSPFSFNGGFYYFRAIWNAF